MLLGTAFSEDAPKPKFTNPVLTTYSKAVEDADLQALRVKREARNKAVFALGAEINKAMSAKDLDKAVWLREEKTRISKEWIPSDGELIGEKPVKLEELIVGKWNKPPKGNVYITFSTDGKFNCNFGLKSGKWKIKGDTIVCVSDTNGSTIFQISKNNLIEDNALWERD